MADTPEMETFLPPAHDRIVTTDIMPLGRMIMNTVRGRVETLDAPGIATIAVTSETRESTIAILLYEPPLAGEECGLGLIHQLHADGARSIAASLWKLADDLGGGKVKG